MRIFVCLGGPLATDGDQPILVGVASTQHIWDGCEKGYPQGFQRVTLLLPWIREVADIY